MYTYPWHYIFRNISIQYVHILVTTYVLVIDFLKYYRHHTTLVLRLTLNMVWLYQILNQYKYVSDVHRAQTYVWNACLYIKNYIHMYNPWKGFSVNFNWPMYVTVSRGVRAIKIMVRQSLKNDCSKILEYSSVYYLLLWIRICTHFILHWYLMYLYNKPLASI